VAGGAEFSAQRASTDHGRVHAVGDRVGGGTKRDEHRPCWAYDEGLLAPARVDYSDRVPGSAVVVGLVTSRQRSPRSRSAAPDRRARTGLESARRRPHRVPVTRLPRVTRFGSSAAAAKRRPQPWIDPQRHLGGNRSRAGCPRPGRGLPGHGIVEGASLPGSQLAQGRRGYKMLTASFVSDRIRYCRDEGLSYLAIHNQSTSAVPTNGRTSGGTLRCWTSRIGSSASSSRSPTCSSTSRTRTSTRASDFV
jgi:hypothetical protein